MNRNQNFHPEKWEVTSDFAEIRSSEGEVWYLPFPETLATLRLLALRHQSSEVSRQRRRVFDGVDCMGILLL